jgi:hypothetical protein
MEQRWGRILKILFVHLKLREDLLKRTGTGSITMTDAGSKLKLVVHRNKACAFEGCVNAPSKEYSDKQLNGRQRESLAHESPSSEGDPMSSRTRNTTRAAIAALASLAAFTAPPASAATPAQVAAPPDAQIVASMTATGVQVYACEFDASHQLAWVFKSPLATLYEAHGQEAVRHSAGPTWQAQDGSTIVGHVRAQAPSDTLNSIPQLLLDAKSTAGNGTLSEVHYVQRLETAGGNAPSAPCTSEHETGRSPYFARYVFLK